MKEIVLATSNPGKIAEFQELFSPVICIPQGSLTISDAKETGLSFIENALIKARHASHLSQKPALADDSGLVVQALQGAPGIYSSRFAGEHSSSQDNIALLLENLKNTPDNQRQAFFYCVIVIVLHAQDPMPIVACGHVQGQINHEPQGENGFGYDPVFYLTQQQCTMAQLPAKIKNTLSHRAQAMKQLRAKMAILEL